MLYLVGDESVTLCSESLDGDALGDALVPIFTDRASDELAGLFPRIVSRYQQLRGEQDAMKEFLYSQLGISEDALEAAQAFASGETIYAKVNIRLTRFNKVSRL